MKKSMIAILIVIFIIIITICLLIANALFGNPISKMIAKNSAESYIEQAYPEQDFLIEDVIYNFKTGYYDANIKSESSIDTHFTVSISLNKVTYDSYEDNVLSGWNTYTRIDHEYNQLVEQVFSSSNFPLESEIDFGTIELFPEDNIQQYDVADYGIVLEDLELDKDYDVKKIAETAGHIVYYAQDEDVSFDKAAELLLLLKRELDGANIPFYAIDFNLEKPRTDDGSRDEDMTIYTVHFLYDDIYEEGLTERLKEANKKLIDYYEEQDKEQEYLKE